MIYDEMEDRQNPADERAEAWEFWHERANKFETENLHLRRALEQIFAVGDGYGENTKEHPRGTTGDGHAQCRQIARSALLPKDGTP